MFHLHALFGDEVELHVLECQVDILETNCDQCVSTVQCCFTSTETIRLIRTGSPGWPPHLSHSSALLGCSISSCIKRYFCVYISVFVCCRDQLH